MVILLYRDIFMHSHTALFDRLFTCQVDIHTLMVTLGEILISRTYVPLEGAVGTLKWQFVKQSQSLCIDLWFWKLI